MRKVVNAARSLWRRLLALAFPLRTCHCKLLYKLPEGPVGRIELCAALCADAQTLKAIEIIELRETSGCHKQGGCPWLQAEREGGKAALREKLLIHAASSLYAPDRADSDREVALVQHRNGQPVTVDAAAGESVTVHKPTPDSDAQSNLVPAPIAIEGKSASKAANDHDSLSQQAAHSFSSDPEGK